MFWSSALNNHLAVKQKRDKLTKSGSGKPRKTVRSGSGMQRRVRKRVKKRQRDKNQNSGQRGRSASRRNKKKTRSRRVEEKKAAEFLQRNDGSPRAVVCKRPGIPQAERIAAHGGKTLGPLHHDCLAKKKKSMRTRRRQTDSRWIKKDNTSDWRRCGEKNKRRSKTCLFPKEKPQGCERKQKRS